MSMKPASALLMDSRTANIMMTFVEGHERILKKPAARKRHSEHQHLFSPLPRERRVIYFTTDTQRYDFVENHNMI
jgi:hypothetical protein